MCILVVVSSEMVGWKLPYDHFVALWLCGSGAQPFIIGGPFLSRGLGYLLSNVGACVVAGCSWGVLVRCWGAAGRCLGAARLPGGADALYGPRFAVSVHLSLHPLR